MQSVSQIFNDRLPIKYLDSNECKSFRNFSNFEFSEQYYESGEKTQPNTPIPQSEQSFIMNLKSKASYKSFTSLLDKEIRILIQREEQQKMLEKHQFREFIQPYQMSIQNYFTQIHGRILNKKTQIDIFGHGNLTFGETSIEKIISINQYLGNEQKKNILNKIKSNQKIQKFISIVGKQYSNELNFQLILILSILLQKIQQNQNPSKISKLNFNYQNISDNLFFNSKIKYFNFRMTHIDISSTELLIAFQDVIETLSEVLITIISSSEKKKQNEQKKDHKIQSFKRFCIYNSRNDFVDSEDESEEIFVSRKKIHL